MESFATPTLTIEVTLPVDEGLPLLPRLFDREWVWQSFCQSFGPPEEVPQRFRLQNLLYRPGSWALAGYAAERRWGHWVVEEQFGIELRRDRSPRLFRYPDDPYLPGLPRVSSAIEAHEILTQYVKLHPHHVDVEAIRYLPGIHAVLRHTIRWKRGRAVLFARVLPPAKVQQWLGAVKLVKRSGFLLPWMAGSWLEGGVIWVAGVPGQSLRELIRQGTPPDPELILDGVAPLWSASVPPEAGHVMDLAGAFQGTYGLFQQVLPEGEARRLLYQVTAVLGPFAEAWRPAGVAHNDFHDDQLVLTPSGRLALVDFEEAGPGDPLLDVGTFLAHQRWMAHFGEYQGCAVYRERLRQAALARFGWEQRALNLREAFVLFRLASNPVRELRGNWPSYVERGLRLALETLNLE